MSMNCTLIRDAGRLSSLAAMGAAFSFASALNAQQTATLQVAMPVAGKAVIAVDAAEFDFGSETRPGRSWRAGAQGGGPAADRAPAGRRVLRLDLR